MNKSSRALTWLLGLFLVVMVLGRFMTVYTDYLWMGSLGQAAVFVKLFWTRVALGLVFGLVAFGWLLWNLRLARRRSTEDVTLLGKRLLPDEDRQQIEQFADKALLTFALIAGAYVGLFTAPRQALTWLRFTHSVPFGQVDPLFGKDAGFFVFQLPWWEFLYSAIFGLVVATLVSCVLVHLYQENIRMVGNAVHANRWARKHCLSLLGLAVLLKIYGYRLMQYKLLYSTSGREFSGASYADVFARLPLLYVMMALALITAGLLFATMRRRDFKLAGWSLAGLVVFSMVAGSLYPTAIQRLVVQPNELQKEQPYIKFNIEATRYAYDLNKVQRSTYRVAQTMDVAKLHENRETLKSIRLWDYRPLEATFDTWEALRAYYSFPGIDVDRYRVQDELRQVSISARQIDYTKLPSATWLNQHLVYTHGYGAAVAPVNEADSSGMPVFWVKGLPPRATVPELEIKRAALYYMSSSRPPLIELVSSPETLSAPEPEAAPAAPSGPQMPGMQQQAAPPPGRVSPLSKRPAGQVPYVLVNTKQPELDYPLGNEGQSSSTEQNKTAQYAGSGGVQLNSFLRRVAFALRFMDLQILLTNYLTPQSRIQFNRYLPEALAAVAPFLDYDPDPYLVIADGNLEWVCDAYTSTARYPYSAPVTRVAPELRLPINYIRNPVKVVVDAYEGKPTFYVVDNQDPILRCYRGIFPSLFTEAAQMPPTMRKHLRYPLLQFMIQAKLYGLYHMQDPGLFYSKEDHWTIPQEIYFDSPRMMEPYYVSMRLPGAAQTQFLVMMPFVLKQREDWIAVAWMAAVCDDPDYGKLVAFDFPKGETVMGPMQFAARVNQDDNISSKFSLWNQEGSRVIRGNTLLIPVDGSLLYVEPVYLVSTRSAVPELKRVILAYGEKIVMEPTLDSALYALFGENLRLAEHTPPALTINAGRVPAADLTPPTGSTPAAPAGGAVVVSSELRSLLGQMLQLQTEMEQALSQQDLASYQQKQKQQAELIRRANQLSGG